MDPERRPTATTVGQEWVVEAHGCDARALADVGHVRALFAHMVADLGLHPVGQALVHAFPAPGGVTVLCLLAESHLACHTFPEHRTLCLNLFCCTPRPTWDFAAGLARTFGADRVEVRLLERPYGAEVPVP